MAEASNRSKLLSKSNWGKIFTADESAAGGSKGKFKLTEDVVDFLKPSTEKHSGGVTRLSPKPRIDIAVAQRWPEAADVLNLARRGGGHLPSAAASADGRPRRRRDLAVRFAITPPEIIGRGGDEEASLVIEISRNRAKIPRSRSDRKSDPTLINAAGFNPGGHIRPNMAQRARTLHEPTPAPLQPIPIAPPSRLPLHGSGERLMPRPGLFKRAPTGFAAHVGEPFSPVEQSSPMLLPAGEDTSIDSPSQSFGGSGVKGSGISALNYAQLGSSPVEANVDLNHFLNVSPDGPPSTARVRQRMRAEEGRTLKRASQSYHTDPSGTGSPPLSSTVPSINVPVQTIRAIAQEPRAEPDDSQSSSYAAFQPTRGHGGSQRKSMASSDHTAMGPLGIFHENETSHERPSHLITRVSPQQWVPKAAVWTSPIEQHNSEETGRRLSQNSTISSRPPSSHISESPQNVFASASNSVNYAQPLLSPRNFARPTSSCSERETSPSYFAALAPAPDSHLSPSAMEAELRSSKRSSRESSLRGPLPADVPDNEALADFGLRVSHMMAVLKLTAEREQLVSRTTSQQWLRCAVWWLHQARTGLDTMAKQRSRTARDLTQELLTQAHVDLAKTWWISTDILGDYNTARTLASDVSDQMTQDVSCLSAHLRALARFMGRHHIMPPYNALINGQNTAMWVQYPRFAPDLASLLSGDGVAAPRARASKQQGTPLDALPLGDTRDMFLYSRMFVSASLSTDDASTDRVKMPCILSVLRASTEYEATMVIASQNELINVRVNSNSNSSEPEVLRWHDVSWKARSHGIYIRLADGHTVNIELQESDFRSLKTLVDFMAKTGSSLVPLAGEKMVYRAQLAEAQYSDSSSSQSFPKERVRGCAMAVFEKSILQKEATGARLIHQGYRVTLITPPTSKTLSAAIYNLDPADVILYEMTPQAKEADGAVMILYKRQSQGTSQMQMSFIRSKDRALLAGTLSGIVLQPKEQTVVRLRLKSFDIDPAEHADATLQFSGEWQKGLGWRGVTVINGERNESGQEQAKTVLSPNLRTVMEHNGGSCSDRMSLGKCDEVAISLRSLTST